MKLPTYSLIPLAFSSLLAPAVMADPIPSPISIDAPAGFRIVQGTTPAPLQFSATNSAADTTTFDVSLTDGSTGSLVKMTQPDAGTEGGVRTDLASGTPWSGASLLGSNTGTLFAQPNLSAAVAGDVVNFGISANNVNWTSPVSASTAINVVQNRLLTGSVTIDAGRHMAGTQPIGTITLNGGALTGLQGTNIRVHEGGVAQLANGLRLTSATGFTFDDADQTHDLQISYNRPAGSYSISTTLPGAGASNYTDASGVKHQEFGGSWSSTAQYGNALGETAVLSAPNSTVWLKPGTTGSNSSDYIRTNDLASTPQPVFAETRSGTSPSGVTTPGNSAVATAQSPMNASTRSSAAKSSVAAASTSPASHSIFPAPQSSTAPSAAAPSTWDAEWSVLRMKPFPARTTSPSPPLDRTTPAPA